MKIIKHTSKGELEIFIVRGYDKDIQTFFFQKYPKKEINIVRGTKDYQVIVKP
jgi:hypothetical protein